MLPYKSLLVVMAVIALSWLTQGTTASAVRNYNSQLDDKTRQEVIALAGRIVKLAMYGYDWNEYHKRNGGTADTLFNMPDLEDVGR
ncbi:unnamed protein product [Candidula unifasciata]|uniref:Uncharacterized protein n=1 Tax=Candidula unifasciata TaxID=100452 RepID=A0A8S3Z6L3_9EUPU|nr:unnamed protein product [Candidula unifasciata]